MHGGMPYVARDGTFYSQASKLARRRAWQCRKLLASTLTIRMADLGLAVRG